MPECIISGVPVNFPFEPYEVQKAYMTKVIYCLENSSNGVLESPTGTGKTLSLLCSTLAWILFKKSQMQVSEKIQQSNIETDLKQKYGVDPAISILNGNKDASLASSVEGKNWGVPKIIYASRTHSQLTQAMQELKRSSYSFMRAVVLGSRDQLCIHPEVANESSNSQKIQMCKVRVSARTCSFYLRVDSKKNSPEFRMNPVMDIEDLVDIGRKLRMCPYFGSKELVSDADITFMPYNYLLDPKARKANKVELNNTIVILDEAHNVEKMCEESASIQIKSSDIALSIEDITHVMKALTEDAQIDFDDAQKDFTIDDLALLKEMLLELEKAVDGIQGINKITGTTYPGEYIFELLSKANINAGNQTMITKLLDSLIQFLSMASENNSMFRKGIGLQILADLLIIVFVTKEEDLDKVKRCFKVHVEVEEVNTQKGASKKDGWITTKSATASKTNAKIINYWCFSPGFGMEQLLNKNVRSIILTSGTLAPLTPLIAELGIPISTRLENPHIVSSSQVCVKIVPCGPDKEILNSNYKNRDNPKYISSLGRTILSFCPVIPDGLLIFFPSYPIMNKCIDSWQASGIWTQINRHKPVFVEPRGKEAFNNTMTQFYEKINDPNTKGACFMAVCRGKVAEGLDFADKNGRAVIITGLPYPPLKDPRIILKKKYLDENRTRENELLSGDSWYALEATRAVNQAIGRVIRHKNDYGAILLCDSRFNFSNQKSQLSSWIQGHLNNTQQASTNFGPLIGEVSRFFRNAEKTIPSPALRASSPIDFSKHSDSKNQTQEVRRKISATVSKSSEFPRNIEKANEVTSWNPVDYSDAMKKTHIKEKCGLDFMSRLDSNVSAIDFNISKVKEKSEDNLVSIHKRVRTPVNSMTLPESTKKRRLKIMPNEEIMVTPSSSTNTSNHSLPVKFHYSTIGRLNKVTVAASQQREEKVVPYDRQELLKLIKRSVRPDLYKIFVSALMSYQKEDAFQGLCTSFADVFQHPTLHYLLKGMRRFIKEAHKDQFDEFVQKHVEK